MNDRLKSVLRQGDPAADDPGLSPAEIQAMRRTLLSAVPEPRRHLGWLVPVLAAAAILAAVLGLSFWRQPAPVGPTHPINLASEGRVVAPSPAQRGRVGEGASPSAPARPARDVKVARVRPRPRPVPKPEPAIEIARTETQQIQFSTPGGTRVIWVLNRTAE